MVINLSDILKLDYSKKSSGLSSFYMDWDENEDQWDNGVSMPIGTQLNWLKQSSIQRSEISILVLILNTFLLKKIKDFMD